MNTHKKISILVCAFLTTLCIVACGQAKEGEFAANQRGNDIQTSESTDSELEEDEIINVEESSVNQQESNAQTVENTDSETKGDETINAMESSVNQSENSAQPVENPDSETTAEELLDLFINGSIDVVDSIDLTSAFYITDLNMDSEEWDSYSIGERVDLDNDGEDELVISGPYGGIYLDARNNKVYKLAAGEGNALMLSYTYYNGAIWIMYSNSMNAGYEAYHMEKFEGADNLVAEMNFGEELVDPNDSESETKYTLNGTIISYDEYTELCSKIFAAQVETN
ncbi:MAG: hypothetical protein HDR06_20070 [Lachnospiraceae bacterium]|nr:hypothetical protein [Lachnospiraceae bacterium]